MRSKVLFIGIFLALLSLLLNSYMMFFTSQKFNTTVELRHRYREQAKQVVYFLSQLINAETGARGYIITNNKKYLQPYSDALSYFNSIDVKKFLLDEQENPVFSERLKQVQILQQDKLDELKEAIEINEREGFEAAKKRMETGKGEEDTEKIRQIILSIIEDQDEVLKTQTQEVEKDFSYLLKAVILSNLLYFLVFSICLLFLYRDIEKRIKTEERLEAINHLQDIVLKTVKESIITLDMNGRITSFNNGAQALFGYTQEQVYNLPFIQLLDEFGNKLYLQNYSERYSFFFNNSFDFLSFLTNNNILQDYICKARKKTGESFFINLKMTALTDKDEEVHGYLLEGSDITERKKWEEKLIETHQKAELASQAKSQFMSNISHDLRTPLTSIIGFSYIFEKKKVGDTITAEDLAHVTRIEENGKLLLNLINTVLDLDRIDHKEMEIKISPVNLSALLHSIVKKWEPQIIKKNLRLVTDIPFNLELFYTDEQKIFQILNQLVENAVKFTQQGSITIVLRRNEKINLPMQIDIIDTGIGIQESELSLMFKPFSQLSGAMRVHYGGSGLGLSMCKSLCDLLGYSIVVKSEYGRGSTFSVILSNAGNA